MRQFAAAYPRYPFLEIPQDDFRKLPIGQVALDQLQTTSNGFVQVPLSQIFWYHHISLLPKVKDEATRSFYILETVANGWSRDVMLA